MQQIPEPDWKIFRELHQTALQRFAERSLKSVSQAQARSGKSSHEIFQDLYRLINDKNKEVARLFDDFRRSTALHSLLGFKDEDLLTEKEISLFSEETRKWLDRAFS